MGWVYDIQVNLEAGYLVSIGESFVKEQCQAKVILKENNMVDTFCKYF